MGKGCHHCQKLQQLYPEREYYPKSHSKDNCPILAETRCYNCGEIGHTPKYCKKPKIKCIHCGRVGHTADMCDSISTENVEQEHNFKRNPMSWVNLNQMLMDFESNV